MILQIMKNKTCQKLQDFSFFSLYPILVANLGNLLTMPQYSIYLPHLVHPNREKGAPIYEMFILIVFLATFFQNIHILEYQRNPIIKKYLSFPQNAGQSIILSQKKFQP